MRASRLCHKLLLNTSIHKRRIDVLGEVVETVVKEKTLSVTQVGRRMENRSQPRSNIRKADRLYSNGHLFSERNAIYKALSATIIKVERPFVAIDGSKVPNSHWYILRASLVAEGRGMTLYEQMYERREQGDRKLYRAFLDNLEMVLGGIKPILITDAEFRGPWFDLVLEKGWDYIARLRGNAKVSLDTDLEADDWQDLWPKASAKPKKLGAGFYGKRHEIEGHFYIYKSPSKRRHAHTRSGRHSKTIKSKRQKASAIEPWLIFSSLNYPARYIIEAYRFRMTIEENFRDTKSGRYGLGLKMTYSKKKKRYAIMLLIAAIASVIAYIVGTAAELDGLHRKFQANSTQKKRVLSRFFLGCEIIYRCMEITIKQWGSALKHLQEETISCFNY